MADTATQTSAPEFQDVLLEARQAGSIVGHDSPLGCALAPAAGPAPAGVLIVDDESTIRSLLGRCCVLNGLQPFLAAGGEEAVEIYRREGAKIGVALLDVRMPGMSGPDTLEALRRLNPQIRCCFMSGDLGEFTPEELHRRGALYLFDKPLPLRELIAALRTVLAGSSSTHG